MTKTYCDRCGKVTSSSCEIKLWKGLSFKRFDICNSCFRKLNRWMGNKIEFGTDTPEYDAPEEKADVIFYGSDGRQYKG